MKSAIESSLKAPVIRARVPHPLNTALQAAAHRSGQSLSACMRELLTEGLRRRQLWPPSEPPLSPSLVFDNNPAAGE
jgi:hypothetical protein